MTTFEINLDKAKKFRTTDDLSEEEREEITRIFEEEPDTPLIDIANKFNLSMVSVTHFVVRKIIKERR